MQAMRARRIKTPQQATPTKTGAVELSLDHPDQAHGHALLMNAFATGESDFIGELLVQLGRAAAELCRA